MLIKERMLVHKDLYCLLLVWERRDTLYSCYCSVYHMNIPFISDSHSYSGSYCDVNTFLKSYVRNLGTLSRSGLLDAGDGSLMS